MSDRDRDTMILDLGRHASEQARKAILRAADLVGGDPDVAFAITLVVCGGVVGAAAGFLSMSANRVGEEPISRADAYLAVLDHLRKTLGRPSPAETTAATSEAGVAP